MSGYSAVSQAAFEAKYRQSDDPWNFSRSEYELNRYEFTLRSLLRPCYGRAFEPACSIGVLTAALAGRCEELYASDIAPSAVAIARQRCMHLPQVTITCADLGATCPSGPFDLIVFSEVGYYFSTTSLSRIARSLSAQLAFGGEFIGVHWLGESNDHLLHGDQVHATLLESLGGSCRWIKGARYPGFRVDTWRSQ